MIKKDTWTDITVELYREYIYQDGTRLRIENPAQLLVSASGGHRIITEDAVCYYIATGWIAIEWRGGFVA